MKAEYTRMCGDDVRKQSATESLDDVIVDDIEDWINSRDFTGFTDEDIDCEVKAKLEIIRDVIRTRIKWIAEIDDPRLRKSFDKYADEIFPSGDKEE